MEDTIYDVECARPAECYRGPRYLVTRRGERYVTYGGYDREEAVRLCGEEAVRAAEDEARACGMRVPT